MQSLPKISLTYSHSINLNTIKLFIILLKGDKTMSRKSSTNLIRFKKAENLKQVKSNFKEIDPSFRPEDRNRNAHTDSYFIGAWFPSKSKIYSDTRTLISSGYKLLRITKVITKSEGHVVHTPAMAFVKGKYAYIDPKKI